MIIIFYINILFYNDYKLRRHLFTISNFFNMSSIFELYELAKIKDTEDNFLLFLKTNKGYLKKRDSSLRTLLHNASSYGNIELVKAILQLKCDDSYINCGDNTNHRALHLAILRGHFEIVKILHQYGARLDLHTTPYKWSVLHCAAYSGNESIISYLFKYGVCDSITTDGIKALKIANTHWSKSKPHIVELFK